MAVELCADIERTIFELSVAATPRMARWLPLVAHRVKAWIDPLLYGVIVLTTRKTAIQFAFALQSNPSLASHIRTLHLGPCVGYFPGRIILQVLSSQKLQTDKATSHTLDYLSLHFTDPRLQPFLSFLAPKHLELTSSGFSFDFEDKIPCFATDTLYQSRLTHLYLMDRWELWVKWAYMGLFQSLPNVTHLSLLYEGAGFSFAWSIGMAGEDDEDRLVNMTATTILEDCLSLEVLLFLTDDTSTLAMTFASIEDVRLVVARKPREVEIQRNWNSYARGGSSINMWSRAEELVRLRIAQESAAL
ncbi:hypothetical protein BDN72DRAFT_892222 [Pluteus cervinus]|uniref:Uncharacterized protein n=1 Tax=Pluteus cervinus TaxID=181527 RepID=A0ACD3BD07_9AGAR|nr:hypothetical protein BDN72DRAFT_892222 [Pluteus cervinus]